MPNKNTQTPGRHRGILVWMIVFIVGVLIYTSLFSGKSTPPVTYNTFLQQLESKQVKSITAYPATFKLKVKTKAGTEYSTGYPSSEAMTKITNTATNEKVPLISEPSSSSSLLLQLVVGFLPIIFILGLLFWFARRASSGGPLGLGRSIAKRFEDNDGPSVTFNDIAGVDEALEEVREIEEFLKTPERFLKLGAKVPRGVLLYGPAGTGKTLLARALAGQTGVSFYSLSGSSFNEVFVGVGASRVRSLFQEAKQNAPAIIFIDEIDSVGRNRGNSMNVGHDESGQTLNELLNHMDGFAPNENVIVFGATNRVDVLDPALTRPGRFDRQILVDRPDRKGRAAILGVHTRGKPLAKSVDLDTIAAGTPGFTGADLANVVNEAAIYAARKERDEITREDIQDAILRAIAGPEKKVRMINDEERKIAAYHEVGHAIVAHYLPHCDPVHKISIISRGRALGYTISLPEEDTFLSTKQELLEKMAMALGGRAAENVIFNEVTTGASNDLEVVTAQAKRMVMRFAMGELGMRTFGRDETNPYVGLLGGDTGNDYSPEIAQRIDAEIEKLTNEAYDMAQKTLLEHEALVHIISEALMTRETLDKEEFEKMVEEQEAVDGKAGDAKATPTSSRRSSGPAQKKTSKSKSDKIQKD